MGTKISGGLSRGHRMYAVSEVHLNMLCLAAVMEAIPAIVRAFRSVYCLCSRW